MSNFKQDLKSAERFERLTIQALNHYGFTVTKGPDFEPGTHPPDLIMNGLAVDVKHDIMSKKTGNIFIEEKSTHHDFLVYYVDSNSQIYMIPMKGILDRLSSDITIREVATAGDAKNRGGKHKGWIVPISSLEKLAVFKICAKPWLNNYNKLKGK